MKSVVNALYPIYGYLFLIPFSFLWSFLCGWAAAISSILISQRFGSAKVGGLWARVIGWLTPMRVTVQGLEHIDPQKTYVVVCNHQSQYDIILVYGWLGLDLRWVMKKELRKLPGIGIACEKVGHIFVDRSDPEAARQAIHEALERIGNGVGVLFFPEGTRSPDGRLKSFKNGAFRLAAEQGLPILPLTLLGTREILPPKSLRVRPGRATIVIHEPIVIGDKTSRDLAREARTAIASALPAEAV